MFELISGFLLRLTFVIPFGPMSAFLVDATLKDGFKQGVKALLGLVIMNLFFIILVSFGLASVYNFLDQKIMFFIGALVLFFMAVKSDKKNVNPGVSKSKSYLTGAIMLGLLNPFEWVWWTTVYGSIVSPFELQAKLVFGLGILLTVICWFSTVIFVVLKTRKHINEKTIDKLGKLSSAVLILFALYFVYLAFTV
ncbi:MAG: LysE family transporter [Candidatus Micrarchaeia archaeon]